MFDGYITIDNSTPSKSGLYVVDLPGATIAQLSGLQKDEQADYEELFQNIYKNAQINLKIDLQKKLYERFHIDKKLDTRETSEYKTDVNANSGLAGVRVRVWLPKYARLQILTIGVKANSAVASPGMDFVIKRENASGETLSTISAELTEGVNTIRVYEDFEEEELFIGYDPADADLIQTKNRYYDDCLHYDEIQFCGFPCLTGEESTVWQVNGGGVNVKFVLYCSMEKFLLENLPLFQYALWYRIGVDLMKERIVSDRVNRFTVLTTERAQELLAIFNEEYANALDAATMNISMREDPICFRCKSTVSARVNLP